MVIMDKLLYLTDELDTREEFRFLVILDGGACGLVD